MQREIKFFLELLCNKKYYYNMQLIFFATPSPTAAIKFSIIIILFAFRKYKALEIKVSDKFGIYSE